MRASLFLLLCACGPKSGDTYVSRDVRVDQDDSGSDARAPIVCASGAFRYVAWRDARTGVDRLYARASVDHGRTWSTEVEVSQGLDAPEAIAHPALGCDEGRVALAWEDPRDGVAGEPSIYLSTSRDAGRTFADPVAVTDDPEGAWDAIEPDVAVRGDHVHVVWTDGRHGAFDVLHRASDDFGATWSEEVRLDTDRPGGAWSGHPKLALGPDGAVAAVWEDARNGTTNDIRLNVSSAAGAPGTWWADDLRLDVGGEPADSDAPALAWGASGLIVAWHDRRFGEPEVLVTAAADPIAGAFPAPVSPGSDAPGAAASWSPQVAASGDRLLLAWMDLRHGATDVLVSRSDDLGATWAEETWLDHAGGATHATGTPSLHVDGAAAAVAWSDLRDSSLDDPREDVYVATTEDAGDTWSDAWRLDDDGAGKARSVSPSVMVDAALGLVDVAWEEWRYGDADVMRRPTRLGGPREVP